ncbi:hypothetical protein [uncultured Lacinutrix sp.]|uniref:hypothetical protein n=1 Tax=uncultured Lacinutrix sp. TaxID=574032 RepID=UPI00260ED583|nr:hypothetical protein [uncultured Lacinutrix sp.]
MKNFKKVLFLAVALVFASTQLVTAQEKVEAEVKVEKKVEVENEEVEVKTILRKDAEAVKSPELKDEKTELKRMEGEGTKEDDLDIEDNDDEDDND